MKQVILVILVMSLSLSVVFAQGKHRGHHHHPKLSKEAKAALQTFHKETIYPIKKEAHDQFLAGLSQEDKAFLDKKRVEEKALRQEMKAMHQEMKTLRESAKSREEMHALHKEKMAPLREKHKAFMESMKPFMEKNEALVKASMEPIKENRTVWKAKKEAILEQYLSAEEKAKRAARKEEKGERGHRGGHHGHKVDKEHKGERARGDQNHEGKGARGAVRFVLWDGLMHSPKEEQANGAENSSTTIEDLSQTNAFTVSSYPNPAISQTTLLLNLAEASTKVRINLTNAEGQQVWSKSYNKLTKGEHQIDVNLQNLVSGQYFYTVEIGEERITKPLIVNK